jgi:hypothetical protein
LYADLVNAVEQLRLEGKVPAEKIDELDLLVYRYIALPLFPVLSARL